MIPAAALLVVLRLPPRCPERATQRQAIATCIGFSLLLSLVYLAAVCG